MTPIVLPLLLLLSVDETLELSDIRDLFISMSICCGIGSIVASVTIVILEMR